MIRKYIPIDSVEDIDLGRISVANINDRYIDKKGNRFATRFNLRTKKIQIVRIALGEEEARKARGVIVQGLVKRKISEQTRHKEIEETAAEENTERETGYDDNLEAPDLFDIESTSTEQTPTDIGGTGPIRRKPVPEWIKNMGITPAQNVNSGELIALIDENYKLLAERIFGIINNVKNSGVMEKIAEIDDAIDFTNIYDHMIEPKMGEAKKFIGEFEKYAERPEHYYTMIEKDYRKYLQDISEPEVMDFLKAYFVGQCALDVLEQTKLFIDSIIEKTKLADPNVMTPDRKQFLQYAFTTCEFLVKYIKEEGAKILGWMIEQKVY